MDSKYFVICFICFFLCIFSIIFSDSQLIQKIPTLQNSQRYINIGTYITTYLDCVEKRLKYEEKKYRL